MKITNWKDEFTDLKEFIRTHKPKEFHPGVPQYISEADCVNIFFKDEDCYTEKLSDQCDIFKSFKTGEIVGCRIYKVSKIPNQEL
jgi:hypothetical protein